MYFLFKTLLGARLYYTGFANWRLKFSYLKNAFLALVV